MNPMYLLAFTTFALILGFLVRNKLSTKRRDVRRDGKSFGGSSDPRIRPIEKIQESMDAPTGDPRAISKRDA